MYYEFKRISSDTIKKIKIIGKIKETDDELKYKGMVKRGKKVDGRIIDLPYAIRQLTSDALIIQFLILYKGVFYPPE